MAGRILAFERSNLSEAARAVKNGGLIVYPTDTVYGLGANPTDARAVDRLFSVKKRDAKPIPLLCDSIESARRVAVLNDRSVEIAKRYWPGALTIVAPLGRELPFPIHQGTRTVGVRVPASRLCVELIALCGGLLTGTSANLSGRPSCRSAQEAYRDLGGEVDLVLDGGRLEGSESTVVRVTARGVEVFRQGPVRVEEETERE
jgi:L-threonylcarbamoyladenylate synthase